MRPRGPGSNPECRWNTLRADHAANRLANRADIAHLAAELWLEGPAVRIAVIRFSSLGDVLCTGPAVRGLHRAFPEAEIVFVTNPDYRDLAAALPGVSRVAVVERRGNQFKRDLERVVWQGPWDLVADLQGSPKSRRMVKALNPVKTVTDTPPRLRRSLLITTRIPFTASKPVPERMLSRLAKWDIEDDGGSLKVDLPKSAVARVEEQWGDRVHDAVALVPGAKHETKRWPGRHWAELVKRLPQSERIVVVGGEGETPKELAEALKARGDRALDLTGETTPMELATVLSRAKVVISGDTGPMHLAVATGRPLVAIFGPTVRAFGFFPYKANSVVLEQKLWCRPCSAHGGPRCPLGHHHCMVNTTPEDVLDASAKLGVSLKVAAGAEK